MPKDGLQTYLDFCRNQIFSNEDWPTGSREVSDLFEVLGRSTAPRSRSPVRRRASFGSQGDVSFDDMDEDEPARKKRYVLLPSIKFLTNVNAQQIEQLAQQLSEAVYNLQEGQDGRVSSQLCFHVTNMCEAY